MEYWLKSGHPVATLQYSTTPALQHSTPAREHRSSEISEFAHFRHLSDVESYPASLAADRIGAETPAGSESFLH